MFFDAALNMIIIINDTKKMMIRMNRVNYIDECDKVLLDMMIIIKYMIYDLCMANE